MTYKSYQQVMEDIKYMEELEKNIPQEYLSMDPNDFVNTRTLNKLKKIWLARIDEKYESTKKSNTQLGRFLVKYPLKLKEFCVLLELTDRNVFDIDEKDPFKKYKVRYVSSQLRRFKLVYRIINPLTPMKTVYEVSYRAQLALKNMKYTEEYQLLDMALEEESKRNSPEELDNLYYTVEPKINFNDLVASYEVKDKLKIALIRETKKEQIFKRWGFPMQYGKGTTLNFRGPPGTGKTLAAHCMANELKRKLLIVRYDQLQDSLVGVTEKHIQRVFKIAKAKNAVLFFDEADAIALDRNNLSQSWEMSQVNTLLKELERFDGMCIFATNFAEKYDPAFERRLTMHIDFKLPDNEQRLEILKKLLPKKSRDKNISLDGLDLSGFSGGDIKNIVLNAAGIAAGDDSDKIKRHHIEKAIQIVRSKNEKMIYFG